MCTARVLLRQGTTFVVEVDGDDQGPGCNSQWVARRAASCLLLPSPRDRVLVALAPEPFIVAVIARDSDGVAELRIDGDAKLHARRLHLGASEAMSLTSENVISLLSSKLSLKSVRTELFSEHVETVAKRARASFDEVSLVAKTYDLFAQRIAQRAAYVYRFVEQLDRLRARHFDHRAEELAQIKGKHTVIHASEVAKIDGEQIHVG